MKLNEEQIEQARLEHAMHVRHSVEASPDTASDIKTEMESADHDGDYSFPGHVREQVDELGAQVAPAAWAREYGADLLETAKALLDENVHLRDEHKRLRRLLAAREHMEPHP